MIFTSSLLYDLIGILVALVVVIISSMLWALTYWKRQNIFHIKPSFPFGNAKDFLFGRRAIFDIFDEFYAEAKKANASHGGFYILSLPAYIPIAPAVIKNILQNDFQYFVDRGVYYNEKHDPISAHLFNLEGNKWKELRAKLSPTFTSGKMKSMMPIVVEITERLIKIIDKEPIKDGLEMKEYMARLTTDVIGSIAFGIECNCIENPDAEFRKYAKILLDGMSTFSGILVDVFPNLMKFLGVRAVPAKFSDFFTKAVKDIIDYRETNNVKRKDFLDLLIQLKNRGNIDNEANSDISEKTKITLDMLLAQAFIFYLGGFETTSTTLSFLLYELGGNQEVQDKLRKEVFDVLQRHGNQITYDALSEMKYMDMVVNETLRKYPPLRVLIRVCNQDYHVPGSETTIKKGIKVIVPINSIQYDPEYYPNPEVFDPDRFTEENKKKRHPFTFIPFGEGPRICIGMRFGVMQTKCGLAMLLKNYKFELNTKTARPLKISIDKGLTAVEGGIFMNLTKIKEN
ncbi:cytochrome p450 [Holotrichia oblita]|uniref:Cytochrome p450 n=1 Tax=Holotrichia oblita TaxID=644536 RepID=A0ACB9STU2_HOLOL|nr:cytochrome p450 [Holotrichia oblita]